MKRFLFPLVATLAASAALCAADNSRPAPELWGNQGDGTFVNPVLPGDFSDIDVIKVGDLYVAMTSTFQYSPGMTIFTSRDLVTWRIAGNAINDVTQISPELSWQRMNRYAKGVWAGSLSYHDKRYWVYFGTPDEGFFVTTAPAPEGPWEPLTHMTSEGGWDDCCPFWDDDGQGWFVSTHFKGGYKIWLHKLTPDGKGLVKDSGRVLYQGPASEANKLFKHDGWYLHYFSEVKKNEGRVAMMRRARSLEGPWETRQLNRAKPIDPNQGNIVPAPDGSWWFLTHFGSGNWRGRQANVLPVTWIDGWPILGTVEADGIGTMTWRARLPITPADKPTLPISGETFDGPGLNACWQWNYQPRTDHWSLTERPGFLRLHAFQPTTATRQCELKRAGNTLTQRSMGSAKNVVTATIELNGMADGQKAGLCHYSGPWSTIGVEQVGNVRTLVRVVGSKEEKRTTGPAVTAKRIWLRSQWDTNGAETASYSLDGKTFTTLGDASSLGWGDYRGDRFGVYSYNTAADQGYVDVDAVTYEVAGPTGK
jgi:beta-xylosidase